MFGSMNGYLKDLNDKHTYNLMKYEWARFGTFENYPSENPYAIRLSENGFYYTGTLTTVRCFACNFEINDLPDGSSVDGIHRNGSSRCPFLNNSNQSSLNVPIHTSDNRTRTPIEARESSIANGGECGSDRRQDTSQNAGDGKAKGSHTSESKSAESSMEMDALQTDGSGTRRSFVSTSGQQDGGSGCSAREQFGAANHSETNINEAKKALQHENEQLRRQVCCKVCLDLDACVVFLPCGHMVTCVECAPAMRKCPICRSDIKGTVKAFLP